MALHCLLKSCNDKRLRDFDYLILLGFSGLSIVENDLSISCSIPSSYGQVLFAIFAISIMFPCRFYKARELNTIFGMKSLSQFPFFRCRSFTSSLRHREIDKNVLCSLTTRDRTRNG
jgi:hypothetical protein